MRHPQTLPLGIDIGRTRVRVALVACRRDGAPELLAVATRPVAGDLVGALSEAVAELRSRERRCVFGVAQPAAVLRPAAFPPMRHAERERAARFEASRWIDYSIEDAHVRTVSLATDDGRYAIGVVRKDVIAKLRSAARSAKLQLVAVDDSAYALRRALPSADAVLDIGLSRSNLYVFTRAVPRTYSLRIGGSAFTQAIVAALGTDEITAERRKIAHGITGGEDVRNQLVEGVANALVDCRANGFGDVCSVALVGNGARLDDLRASIERTTAVRVAMATLAVEAAPGLPSDVLRAASPDWCQAYGLALWAAA